MANIKNYINYNISDKRKSKQPAIFLISKMSVDK